MKNLTIALAAVAALTLGAVADARERGHRKGVERHGPAPMEHRGNPRKFQHALNRRQARQRNRIRDGWHRGQLNPRQVTRLRRDQKRIAKLERRFGADGHYTRHERRVLNHALDRSGKRIGRMKHGEPRRWNRHHRYYRWHRSAQRHWHPHRGPALRRHPVVEKHVYPIYQEAPSHSLGVDVETKDFRFSVNKSG